MKLAIAGLCFLGIVAAACAAVVVNGLRIPAMMTTMNSPKIENESAEVGVLFVTRTLSAMTVVDGSMVSTKTMLRQNAPAGYLTNPTEVVGKIISTPLAGGQPFTKNCFADISGPRQLAAVIPRGKRAVGISVTEYGGLDGLIYPGSIVDVMVSFRPADGGTAQTHRDAVTTTLIENIQVLAFEQQTVVSPGKVGDAEENNKSHGQRRVALLVDTRQAKALELAMDQGTLSLALRNPLDSTDGDRDAVSVRSIMGEPLNPAPTVNPEARPLPATQPATVEVPHWDTMIIRGQKVEIRSFPLPPSKDDPAQEGQRTDAGKD